DKEIPSLAYKVQLGTLSHYNSHPYPHDQSISEWAVLGEYLKMQIFCPKPQINPYEFFLSTELAEKNDFLFEGLLVVFDLTIFIAEKFKTKETIIKKLFFPSLKLSLGSYSPSNASSLDFHLKFFLIKAFDFTSNLSFSFSPPSKTPLITFLNNKTYSDGFLQFKENGKKLWVNRKVLSSQCTFFAKMFQKEWSDKNKNGSTHELIDLSNWSDEVIVACILHIYAGWLPGTSVCDEVFKQLNMKASDFQFNIHILCELAETAKMIELNVLELFCFMELKKMVNQEIDSAAMTIGKIKLNQVK
ncbi:hypothetical protein HMI56_000891, partial [Coelomomyces lativittatus]